MTQEFFNRLSDIEQKHIQRMEDEKRQGKPLVAYSSTFVPAELIRAAGANAFMICRGGEYAPAEAAVNDTLECINPLARASVSYISGMTDGPESKADLVVTAFSDSHMSRMSELMEYKGINVFKIGVPVDWQKKISFEYYLGSLRAMLVRVSELTGHEPDMTLARSYFELSNRLKACMREVKELRRRDVVPMKFEEIAKLHRMSFLLNDEEAVRALEDYVAAAKSAPALFDEGEPRLMIIMRAVPAGDYDILRIIDDTGCPVVAEVLDECACVSDSDVDLDGDLIENFARSRYSMALPLNSFQPSWRIRFERIRTLIEEYRISGVVWYQLAHDEIYDMEYSCVSKWLGEMGVPSVKLETDYDYSPEKLTAKRNQINSFIKRVKKARR